MIRQQDSTTFVHENDDSIVTFGGAGINFDAQMSAAKNEDSFNLAHADSGATPELVNGVIKSVAGNREHQIYAVGQNLQWDILYTGPLPQEEVFDIDFSPGSRAIYQPPLNLEPASNLHPDAVTVTATEARSAGGILLNSRPENIVGSYAVYCGKKNGKYKTGKLGHVHAYYLVDSTGQKFKVPYTINNVTKKLTVSFLPAAQWLATIAVGQIRLDPTFGYTGEGGTANRVDDDILIEVADANFTGDVDSIFSYIRKVTAGTANCKGLLYASVSTTEGGLLLTNGDTPAKSFTNTAFAWVEMPYTTKPAVVDTTNYHVCGFYEDIPIEIGYDTGDATETTSRRTVGYPTHVDPLGGTTASLFVSVYASGAAAGGAANPWYYYAQQ